MLIRGVLFQNKYLNADNQMKYMRNLLLELSDYSFLSFLKKFSYND